MEKRQLAFAMTKKKTDSMCYHGKKTDKMCYHRKKRQIACAITEKRQIACVIMEKRQIACTIMEKYFRSSFFYKIVGRFYVVHISHGINHL